MKHLKEQDIILLESLVEKYGRDEVLTEMKLSRKTLAGLAALGIIGSVAAGRITVKAEERRAAEEQRQKEIIEQGRKELKEKKIAAIVEEVLRVYELNKAGLDKPLFDPEKMVELCDEYDYDLPLMLAQARCESLYGLTDRAQRTHSMFSVGNHDDGSNRAVYNNFDESMEPYINLMINDYLVNKDIDSLLMPGQFVNFDNKRYAKNKNYEREVKRVRDSLLAKYPELGVNDNTVDYNG